MLFLQDFGRTNKAKFLNNPQKKRFGSRLYPSKIRESPKGLEKLKRLC